MKNLANLMCMIVVDALGGKLSVGMPTKQVLHERILCQILCSLSIHQMNVRYGDTNGLQNQGVTATVQ